MTRVIDPDGRVYVPLAEHAELRAENQRLREETQVACRQAIELDHEAERLREALVEVRERWGYPKLVAVVDAALDGPEK